MGESSLAKQKRKQIFDKFGGHCAYCGCEIKFDDFTVDHRIPKARDGKSDLENLFPSCFECNQGKGDFLIKELKKIHSDKGKFYFELSKKERGTAKPSQILRERYLNSLPEQADKKKKKTDKECEHHLVPIYLTIGENVKVNKTTQMYHCSECGAIFCKIK